MIFIISALTIYLLLNIKTTYHRAHYTMIVSVVVLCIFQAIPVSEDRKNEQLEKAEKLLQIVEKEKPQIVTWCSEKDDKLFWCSEVER